jgi:signal transduction histidine kinase
VFRNLRTGTKLALLCAVFIAAIAATTYSLVAEKQIAIAFARKELVGTKYLTTVRDIYAAVLAAPPMQPAAIKQGAERRDLVAALAAAQADVGSALQTAGNAETLAIALRAWTAGHDGAAGHSIVHNVLVTARQLVTRIADDSNLALDPDLDSYYLQDIVTRKLPAFLVQLGGLQILSREIETGRPVLEEHKTRFRVIEVLLRSTVDEMTNNLASAYRGNSDGWVNAAIGKAFAVLISSADSYLSALEAGLASAPATGAPDRAYGRLMESSIAAWVAAQDELERLLRMRIAGFVQNLLLSLGMTGALASLSIFIAIMTHRHIVKPLQRLENVASTVRRTKDYSRRMHHVSKDEIGQLAAAFNDMLSELAGARERERAEQLELMRAGRLATMGAMTASIAHEINQPLAAIVANSGAAQRWLSNPQPNLDEAKKALTSIANDGHRASQVIAGVRAMFKKDSREKTAIAVNDVIDDVLALVQGEIRKQRVVVRTELLKGLPDVLGDRTQLLQVFLNLTRNALEAMSGVTDRERLLMIKSETGEAGAVVVTVADSGPGVDPGDTKRIFDSFYTTKSDGMGMGLSICRSIVEVHGGRLWASPGPTHGSVFHVELPGSGR